MQLGESHHTNREEQGERLNLISELRYLLNSNTATRFVMPVMGASGLEFANLSMIDKSD